MTDSQGYYYKEKIKQHRKNPLTYAEHAFLDVIWIDHVGKDNRISAEAFARKYAINMDVYVFTKKTLEGWKRKVRAMQNHLLFNHDLPVLSRAGNYGGYWIAETSEEGKVFYGSFRKRAMTGMVKASCGKKSAMVDMVTQLSFQFEDLVDKVGPDLARRPGMRGDTPVEIVDAFFRKMTEDPERYADGLRRIGEKYGSVLMPRRRFDQMIAAMKAKTAELQGLVASLEE